MNRKLLVSLGALTSLLALLLILGGSDLGAAKAAGKGTFNPVLKVKTSDSSPEGTPDVTVDFNLPSGDLQFAAVLAFVPKETGIVPGNKIPVGAKIGELDSNATLGLINAACNTVLPVHFDFFNGSLDTKDTVEFTDVDHDTGQGEVFEDANKNGLLDGIDKWPAFINRLFPNIADKTIRRSVGIASVAGVGVLLQFLIFPPGTVVQPTFRPEVAHPPKLFPQSGDPNLGYPTLVLLQDIGDPAAAPMPNPITGFCTPLTSTNLAFGRAQDNPDTKAAAPYVGRPVTISPKDGTYKFTVIALSQRDADGDGIENRLDTCPYTPNVGDPRIANSGNEDGDGMDAACDPDPSKTQPNGDQDLDGYLNRGDNCPLVPNGEDKDNQKDSDLVGIGDACNIHLGEPDKNGEMITRVLTQDIKIGTGTGPGGPPDCSKLGVECWQPGSSSKPEEGGGGGLSTGALVGIIAAAAAVIVIGGGAAVVLRRRG